MKFHICDEIEYGKGQFCIASNRAFNRAGNSYMNPRCRRHGQFYGQTINAQSAADARKQIKAEIAAH